MIKYIFVFGLIFLLILCVSAMLIGIGMWWQKLIISERKVSINTLFDAYFIGIVIATFASLLLHFVAPINEYWLYMLMLIGVTGWLANIKLLSESITYTLIKEYRWVILLLAIVLLVITAVSFMPISFYDTGLYHIQNLRWIQEYPILPGLANIHSRFGFNSSFFLTVAPIDAIQIAGQSGFKLLMASLLFIPFAKSLVAMYSISKAKITRHNIFWAGLIPFLIYLVFVSPAYIPSISPDLPVYIFTFVIFGLLFRSSVKTTTEEKVAVLSLLVLFSSFVFTIKSSSAVFALLAMMVAAILNLKLIATLARSRVFLATAVLAISMFVFWVISSLIISGYPLYPLTIGRIDTDWTLPISTAQSEASWIASWARTPGAHPDEVLSSWSWLSSWARGTLNRPEIVFIIVSTIILGVMSIRKIFLARGTQNHRRHILLVVPLGAIAFWFVSAPDPRFILATLWIFVLYLFIGWLDAEGDAKGLLVKILIFALLFTAIAVPSMPITMGSGALGNNQLQQDGYTSSVTKGDLTLYYPLTTDQCWDAPLPCSPGFNYTLGQRNKDNILEGFRRFQ